MQPVLNSCILSNGEPLLFVCLARFKDLCTVALCTNFSLSWNVRVAAQSHDVCSIVFVGLSQQDSSSFVAVTNFSPGRRQQHSAPASRPATPTTPDSNAAVFQRFSRCDSPLADTISAFSSDRMSSARQDSSHDPVFVSPRLPRTHERDLPEGEKVTGLRSTAFAAAASAQDNSCSAITAASAVAEELAVTTITQSSPPQQCSRADCVLEKHLLRHKLRDLFQRLQDLEGDVKEMRMLWRKVSLSSQFTLHIDVCYKRLCVT